MKTKNNIYTFWSDAEHGWLEVPISEILSLGLYGKISSCSYLKGDNLKNGIVFLEEDCDAPKFIEAKKHKGIEIKIEEKNTEDQSKEFPYIRNCRSFK